MTRPKDPNGNPPFIEPTSRDAVTSRVLSELELLGPLKPSDFMRAGLQYFKTHFRSDNSLNGAVLQALVERCLVANGVVPVYSEVTMRFIPVARYDIIVFTRKHGPINLSLKTSLRERWKQAEFEGMALRRVYRRSRVYVVNNSENETRTRKTNMAQCEAIHDFVVCTSPAFDSLVKNLLAWGPKRAPVVRLVSKGKEVALPPQIETKGRLG
jgi:hypothetical protein